MDTAFQPILSHLQKELATLQVGRVMPAVLDDVMVEAYGTHTPIPQLATVGSQGANLLTVQPWDASIIKDIERALRTCGRDYNPAVDGQLIRIPFPPLTEEKRKAIVKLVAERGEEAKVQIKLVREELMHTIKTQKTNKEISEDQAFAQQKDIQKAVDQAHQTVSEFCDAKAADVMKL